MRAIYISHPYTGNEDRNRAESIWITAKLARKHPDILFVNPLSAMYHVMTAKLDYDTVMEQCVALLRKCDGMILTGDWEESRGCNIEMRIACSDCDMHIWNGTEEFEEWLKGEENWLKDKQDAPFLKD